MFNSEIETSEQVTKFWTDLVDFVPILTFHCSRRIPDADTSSLEPPGTRGMTVYFSRLLLMWVPPMLVPPPPGWHDTLHGGWWSGCPPSPALPPTYTLLVSSWAPPVRIIFIGVKVGCVGGIWEKCLWSEICTPVIWSCFSGLNFDGPGSNKNCEAKKYKRHRRWIWHHGAKVDWVSLGGRRTSIYVHVWYYGHIMI